MLGVLRGGATPFDHEQIIDRQKLESMYFNIPDCTAIHAWYVADLEKMDRIANSP